MPSKFFIDAAIRVQDAKIKSGVLNKVRTEFEKRLQASLNIDEVVIDPGARREFLNTVKKISEQAQSSFDKINGQFRS